MILFISVGAHRNCLTLALLASMAAPATLHIVDDRPRPLPLDQLVTQLKPISTRDYLPEIVPIVGEPLPIPHHFAVQTSVPPMPHIPRPQEADTYG